jgi:hypothetical protein
MVGLQRRVVRGLAGYYRSVLGDDRIVLGKGNNSGGLWKGAVLKKFSG